MTTTLDPFTRAYLTAALWTNDPDPRSGEFCERDGWDLAAIAPASLERAIAECRAFQDENAADLAEAGDDSQNGHDFWLTRNGHGCGFWSRGYPKPLGERLTKAAESAGERYVMGPETGDNGSSTPAMLEAWDGVIYIE